MFMAGIIPDCSWATFAIAALFYLRNDKNIIAGKNPPEGNMDDLQKAFWGLLTPVIILGEYTAASSPPRKRRALQWSTGCFRDIRLQGNKVTALFRIFVDASVSSAIIMFIMGCAGPSRGYSPRPPWPQTLGRSSLRSANNTNDAHHHGIFHDRRMLRRLRFRFLLLLPIILPIVKKTGYPMYAFGVLATVNFAIGQITPPVGSNLFVACNIADVTMRDLVSKVWPFLIAGIVCLLLMTFFPQIITCLPSLLGLS
jgi:C4-dicarboxylate transporter DctM subunit